MKKKDKRKALKFYARNHKFNWCIYGIQFIFINVDEFEGKKSSSEAYKPELKLIRFKSFSPNILLWENILKNRSKSSESKNRD